MTPREGSYRAARGGSRRSAGRWFVRATTLVTGRRGAWLVLGCAVLLAGLAGPLAGKLPALEDNAPTSFLPAGAGSTALLRFEEAHDAAAATPAVVVFARRDGLGRSGLAVVRRARARVGTAHLPDTAAPSPVAVAADGRAASFSVAIAASAPAATLDRDVAAIRRLTAAGAVPAVDHPPAGVLAVAVGGPAGSAADAVGAFSGIDGRLLAVTVLVVALLLLLIYRSPVLWLLPLVSVGLAAAWSEGATTLLARSGAVVNGMTVGILTVLVFGAGTDYALLLMARYREELRRHEDPHAAMAVALQRAGPVILTSGATVVLALLCLMVAQLRDIAALGPVCAIGVGCALVAQLAVLPALLVVTGRRVLWPAVPRVGDPAPGAEGRWARLGGALERHRRPVWVGLGLLLAGCCVGLLAYRGGVDQENGFRGLVGSVAAQRLLEANFPAGQGAPISVLVERPATLEAVEAAVRAVPDVAAVSGPEPIGAADLVSVTLRVPPTSAAAAHAVVALRHRLATASPGALVGGETATNVDIAAAASHDRATVIPLVAVVVLVMLAFLLRCLLAPLLLVASVLLSYLASLGVAALVTRSLFGFPGFDPTVAIFGFVFLVALGVDYTVFLMARVREEAGHLGTVPGVQRGLEATGSVITSAGVVLAATFTVLAVLPLIALTEVGFLVAFGVLVDTVLVRSALVPALAMDLGDAIWWPSRRQPEPPPGAAPPGPARLPASS